jgi:hypothetical protein
MSNEISPEGQPSAFTEEDRLSAMIVERDVEIARLKGVIEHLQGVIGGLHMEAAQRDALTTKPAADLHAAPLTDAQISKAARYLSDKCADECAVDKNDYWKIYGQEAVDELRAAIAEAGAARPAAPVEAGQIGEQHPVIDLGYGAIEVGEGLQDGKIALIFGRNGSGVLGEEMLGNRTMESGEALAAVTFANVESVDVVTEKLTLIRAKLAALLPAPSKAAGGSIGDDRKFCRLARAWDEADHDDGPDPVATWEAFVAYTDSVIAARKAAVGVLTDETEKQAARYRWLRDPTTDVALVIDKVTGGVPVDEMGGGGYRTYEYRAGEELDAAIDAAIESALAAQVSGQPGEVA